MIITSFGLVSAALSMPLLIAAGPIALFAYNAVSLTNFFGGN